MEIWTHHIILAMASQPSPAMAGQDRTWPATLAGHEDDLKNNF